MGINIGGSVPERIQVGGDAVANIYRGADLIWTAPETGPVIPPAPEPGGGLSNIVAGSILVTSALENPVTTSVFGSRYPGYGGQTVAAGGGFTMSAISVGEELGGGGANFGGSSTITTQFFDNGGTITSDFPAGQGDLGTAVSGFNTACGFQSTAPTTPGVYNVVITLPTGESGLYQIVVGGGGGVATHSTPISLDLQGTATPFANSFIGLPGDNPTSFTLGPSTLDTSADCFIAANFPPDLNLVAVSLEPDTSPISFTFVGFSSNIRWFGFRGIPSDLGTGAHTLTVNGVASNVGPPLISQFSGAITADPGPPGDVRLGTYSLDFTIGAEGGSPITEVTSRQGISGNQTALPVPSGGWQVGDYSFTGLQSRISTNDSMLMDMTITNADGTFETLTVTFL